MLKRSFYKAGLTVFICVIMVTASFAQFTFAEELTVNLRIEGISGNIFYGDINVTFEDELTVKDVLIFADENYDELTITGAADNYVTSVNSEDAGTFGGYDGWYYMVNSQAPAVGIGDYVLAGGDSIVLYYADGVTQVPVADLSKIDEGIIKFTSEDTTYDEQWNATVSTNPVTGATVTWSKGDNEVTYTTDENGEILIADDYLEPGIYNLQIEKYDDNDVEGKYLPLALRFADDYTVEITQPVQDVTQPVQDDETQPGDTSNTVIYVIVLVLAIAAVVLVFLKKKKDQ